MKKFTLYSFFAVLLLVVSIYLPKLLLSKPGGAIQQMEYVHSSASYSQETLPTLPFSSTTYRAKYSVASGSHYQAASNPAYSNAMPFSSNALLSSHKMQSFASAAPTSAGGGYSQRTSTHSTHSANSTNSNISHTLPMLSVATQSTTYAPFSNTTPSEVTAEVINNTTQPAGVRGRQNAFTTPGDPDQSKESPIGDPWVMLLFAVLAAVVIRIRTRNKISTLSVHSAEDKQGISKG